MANDWLYRQYFDDKGNWKKPHDPYRDNKSKFYQVFYDEEGYLNWEAYDWLSDYIEKTEGLEVLCDAAKMYFAHLFSGRTKGNYPDIVFWR